MESLSLCDVKCESSELLTLLNRNADTLKCIDLRFTQKCFYPGYSNGKVPCCTPSISSMSSGSIQSAKSWSPKMNEGSGAGSGAGSGTGTVSTGKHMEMMGKLLSDIFDVVLKYLRKQSAAIYQHNSAIKKRYHIKLKDSAKRKEDLDITYIQNMKLLPLKALAFSIPPQVDASFLQKYCEIISFFGRESNHRDTLYTSLRCLYLDGGCITPFTLTADTHPSIVLDWSQALRSQRKNVETLVMKRVLYSAAMFSKHFGRGFVSNLTTIDLQIIYSKTVTVSDSKGIQQNKGPQNKGPQNKGSQNKGAQKRRQPIRRLFESLSQCRRLETVRLDLVQHADSDQGIASGGSSVMVPFVDICWMDGLLKSDNVRNTICVFAVTFNELSTREFESTSLIEKFVRHQNADNGVIIRINEQFKHQIQQKIKKWFDCPRLEQVKLTRIIPPNPDGYFDSECHHDYYQEDQPVDFQYRLPFERERIEPIVDDADSHNVAFYNICKLDDYRGDVSGDLERILQPQNPVE